MIDPRKQAYLEAMGFDVWVARPAPAARDRLVLAPGQGSTLLVCARAGDRETALAADIARAVGDDPSWGWPDPEGRPDAPTLAQAIENGLVTRVVVFGRETAEMLLGADVPAVLKSSAIAVAAGLDELATRGTAKQALWQLLVSGDAGPAAA
jgi:hypothetical protein